MRKEHTAREYAAELRQVRENLLKMAGLVEKMIADATRSLTEDDHELAQATIELDHRVNRLEVDTDEVCLLILAKRQPVASDLRFITLAMKMVTDLERIGDLGVNISERALALEDAPAVAICDRLTRMSEIAQMMIHDSIDAFITGDVEKARAVFAIDEQVDELYRDLSVDLETAMYRDSAYVERGIHLKAVAKFLERIGDHAQNLAELAMFLVEGKDIRHLGKLEPR
jgi:phosphate transport system protein